MGALVCPAGNIPAVDIHFPQQTVHQQRIALADSGTVHQCGIGRILQVIGRIVLVDIVIGNVGADPVIDDLHGFIVRIIMAVQAQVLTEGRNLLRNPFFLFLGGIEGKIESKIQIAAGPGIRLPAGTTAFCVLFQIVATFNSGGLIGKHQCSDLLIDILAGAVGLDLEHHTGLPAHHIFPDPVGSIGHRAYDADIFKIFGPGHGIIRLHDLTALGDSFFCLRFFGFRCCGFHNNSRNGLGCSSFRRNGFHFRSVNMQCAQRQVSQQHGQHQQHRQYAFHGKISFIW